MEQAMAVYFYGFHYKFATFIGFNTILAVVNQSTKKTYFLPYVKSMSSQAHIIMHEVFSHRDLLSKMISDCGSGFISYF
jgi:hypothetical protein